MVNSPNFVKGMFSRARAAFGISQPSFGKSAKVSNCGLGHSDYQKAYQIETNLPKLSRSKTKLVMA